MITVNYRNFDMLHDLSMYNEFDTFFYILFVFGISLYQVWIADAVWFVTLKCE